MLDTRKKIVWPDGKKLALWVNVSLQFFPMNPQSKIKLPGSMSMPYPDLRHYTLRDYGNRVGIYRFFEAFDRYGIKPTMAVNSRIAERAPALFDRLLQRGDELIGHSVSMDTVHAGGLSIEQETEWIAQSLHRLRSLSGQAVRGWLSPGKLESENTPDLIAGMGVDYFCDWVNDDMPYAFRTTNGNLWAMPLSTDLEDRSILMDNFHPAQSYLEQIKDACDLLLAEAQEQGGRILALSVHPWMLGQPHRIAYFEQALAYITSQEGVWCASAGEILDVFKAQQD
jgi:peptidoglycan/xylan/chitin deacetylase (PgdA/CDA1 family)